MSLSYRTESATETLVSFEPIRNKIFAELNQSPPDYGGKIKFRIRFGMNQDLLTFYRL